MTIEPLSPDFQRLLLGLANREGFNATEVAALIEYAEYMGVTTVYPETKNSAIALIEVWKESFDEEE